MSTGDAAGARPERTRTYLDWHLDSSRWDHVEHRPGDIVISTSVKAGTTWTQRIVSLLVFGAGPLPAPLWEVSPWIDERFLDPLDVVLDRIERQEHRRFLKAHVGLDALPFRDDVRYLFVCRDARDVFMSLVNHWSAYTDLMFDRLGQVATELPPFPRCPDDVRAAWRDWIGRGNPSLPWEHDGYPFWSHFGHAETFWPHRGLPNILCVHFNDLKADLDGEMRRIAAFLDIDVDEDTWPDLVEAATLQKMKEQGDELLPAMELGFEGGVQRFLHKGTNRRWLDALTEDDVERYEVRAVDLEPALRRWMEMGRLASGIDPRVV